MTELPYFPSVRDLQRPIRSWLTDMFFFCLIEFSVLFLKSLLVRSSQPADVVCGRFQATAIQHVHLMIFVGDSKGDATKKVSSDMIRHSYPEITTNDIAERTKERLSSLDVVEV